MYCVDTNVVIAVLRNQPQPLVNRFACHLPRGEIALPAIVLFELHYGAANSTHKDANARRIADFLDAPITILPFEADDAVEAGAIRAELKRAGTPIGPYDILIAAQARRHGAALVTANRGEFVRVSGLVVEDWTARD